MDDIGVRPLDDIYTLWFDDGTSLAFTTDQNRMKQQLEQIEPGSFEKLAIRQNRIPDSTLKPSGNTAGTEILHLF
ncbi:MAG: hypothetical protein R2758_02710 [Bacteroidales bacterium]